MKKLLVILGLIAGFIPNILNAGWAKTYGTGGADAGCSVEQTFDGGYIVTGETGGNLWLLKTDADGNVIWSKTYMEGQYSGSGSSVKQTPDNGYIVTGTVAGPRQTVRLWLLKTDEDGNSVWTRAYGSSEGLAGGFCVGVTDNGYVVTGSPWSLLKIDTDGDTLWTRISLIDAGYCVQEASDNSFTVTGDSSAKLSLVKTDADGNVIWTRTYGGEAEYAKGRSVHETQDGGYIVAGSKTNGKDLWLLKTDAQGDTIWTLIYASAQGLCLDETYDGGFIVTGVSWTKGDLLLLKADKEGKLLWTRTYGGQNLDRGSSVQETSDRGFIITGTTQSFGAGNSDLWLLKTNSQGDTLNSSVAEPPAANRPSFEISSPIGSSALLKYRDFTQGFAAGVFDAAGRKVDEIDKVGTSGALSWGEGYAPGVYFIQPKESSKAQKVILVR